jgi:hypothetical protein
MPQLRHGSPVTARKEQGGSPMDWCVPWPAGDGGSATAMVSTTAPTSANSAKNIRSVRPASSARYHGPGSSNARRAMGGGAAGSGSAGCGVASTAAASGVESLIRALPWPAPECAPASR